MFRFITFSEAESSTREWTHQQQFQPQSALTDAGQPFPPLHDANGFFNVGNGSTMPIADGSAITPRQPADGSAVTPRQPADDSAVTPRQPDKASTATPTDSQAKTPLRTPSKAKVKTEKCVTASLGTDTNGGGVKRESQPAENMKKKAAKLSAKPSAIVKRDPEASPDDLKHLKAVEAAMQRSINRVLAAQAQANEIKRLVETDSDWQWMSGTPAIEDLDVKRSDFEKFMSSSNFMKSLLLSAGDLGHFHCNGVLVIPWSYPLGIPSQLPSD